MLSGFLTLRENMVSVLRHAHSEDMSVSDVTSKLQALRKRQADILAGIHYASIRLERQGDCTLPEVVLVGMKLFNGELKVRQDDTNSSKDFKKRAREGLSTRLKQHNMFLCYVVCLLDPRFYATPHPTISSLTLLQLPHD
eukprot:gb/GECG01013653.1/.p1 GENE.gb/GECG01013653.1/~~gb/GECG01013653.1/.p1  ORF type:complete len:140 (+),score=13.64 gb/GECG01013653.1/:1-420(+)